MAREITLSNGIVTLVDDVDYDWAVHFNWHACGGYACRWDRGQRVYLHREVLEHDGRRGDVGDHIDCDRLNNRRSNLRPCTAKENSRNGRQRSTVQPYKGVSRDAVCPHLWRARIGVDGKLLFLGHFDDAADAARAYDAAALVHFGEFARPNFADATTTPPPARRQCLARGERVKGAKLNAATVLEMRRQYAAGSKISRIAREHGVTFGCANMAVRGLTWAHLGEAA